jgi:hypothetical protein
MGVSRLDRQPQSRARRAGRLAGEPLEPLEPLPDCFVSADITKRALPGLGVMSGTLCGLRQAPLECELAPLH